MSPQQKDEKNVESAPWGRYAPSGRDKGLLALVKTGLSHGPLKKLIQRKWLGHHPDAPVDITYHGVRLRLYPWNNAIEAKILFGSKQREKKELEAMRAFAGNGSVFIDIGANIGYYSLMAAAFGVNRIVAVEPNPVAYSCLAFNVSTNRFDDQVSTYQLALGDSEGTVTLFIPEGDMGGSRINDPAASGQPVQVPMQTMTSLLDSAHIQHIDVLKIDVEGMEDRILFPFYAQAPRSLWPRMVIIEPTSRDEWQRDILSWMREAGYQSIGRTRSNVMLALDDFERL